MALLPPKAKSQLGSAQKRFPVAQRLLCSARFAALLISACALVVMAQPAPAPNTGYLKVVKDIFAGTCGALRQHYTEVNL